MQVPNAFDALVGKLVKIVYRDSGGEVKVKKGHLIAVDPDFIRLQTFQHAYVIRRDTISELRTIEEGGRA